MHGAYKTNIKETQQKIYHDEHNGIIYNDEPTTNFSYLLVDNHIVSRNIFLISFSSKRHLIF